MTIKGWDSFSSEGVTGWFALLLQPEIMPLNLRFHSDQTYQPEETQL